MYFEEHAHLRGEKQWRKGTIPEGLEVAKRAGVDAVFDIVNSDNPMTTRERVDQRFEIVNKYLEANKSLDSPYGLPFYGLYLGVTNNTKQIEQCVEVYHDLFPKKGDKVGVIGFKMFAGEFVGTLNLSELSEQRQAYEVLSKNDYLGVLAVHCGRKDLMRPNLWDPENPITHCYARPIEAKVESIKDQVEFAWGTNFQGIIHFFHISSSEEAEYISGVKRGFPNEYGNLRVSCEVTPHHLFLFDELMNEPEGILLKVNPALRTRETAQGLLKYLRQEKQGIDTIGTDHAPHERGKKLGPPYLSGIPGLDLWPRVVRRLREEGFSEERISALTFDNQIKLFGLEEVIQKSDNPGDENLDEYPHLRPKGILKWI